MPDEDAPPAPPTKGEAETTTTRITDLAEDALVLCASYLKMEDISSLSLTCKYLNRVSNSDSLWLRYYREHCPHVALPSSGVRDAYFARQTALRKFKFSDPFMEGVSLDAKPVGHLMMDKEYIVLSQGSLIFMMKDGFFYDTHNWCIINGHNARITCLRLFPLSETSLFRGDYQREEKVLVTSSCDHSIRLWWKDSCQRCFRGHNGPVLTLSDKLLGDQCCKLLASGGEDGTVRLWSLGSSGKRGQHALKATLYGHGKPVTHISVAGHKPSLLVTISMDSKVRVWDTTASAARSSRCVGMTTVPGAIVDLKCNESLLYVAADTSVIAIDLRTMQKVATSAIYQPKICSFGMVPSKFSICTGGNGKALLWDIRRNQNTRKPEPMAELDGHEGPVTFLHMDQYKIVTGGPEDRYIRVWDADTGTQTNSWICWHADSNAQYSAMAVHGIRIVAACHGEDSSVVHFRDFFNATSPVHCEQEDKQLSKFWDPYSHAYSDTDSDE